MNRSRRIINQLSFIESAGRYYRELMRCVPPRRLLVTNQSSRVRDARVQEGRITIIAISFLQTLYTFRAYYLKTLEQYRDKCINRNRYFFEKVVCQLSFFK